MSMFSQFNLDPLGFVCWLAVGLIAGWLAGRIMGSVGYGPIADLIVGPIGAVLGGLTMGLFIATSQAFWSGVMVAAVGALLLIVIVRFVALKRAAA